MMHLFFLTVSGCFSGYLDDKRSLEERMARLRNGTAAGATEEAPSGNDRLLVLLAALAGHGLTADSSGYETVLSCS